MKLDHEALKTRRAELAHKLDLSLTPRWRADVDWEIALIDELVETRAALANSRVATFEEAARFVEILPAMVWSSAQGHVIPLTGESLRALAPLPPSVVCVPAEALEKSKEALRTVYEWASEAMIPYDLWRHFLHTDADGVVMIRAAIAALTKVTR